MRRTLVYDSDCGPCTRFRDVVGFLDAQNVMGYLGLDEAERAGILDRIPPSRRHRSFHLVTDGGDAWSGAEALAPLAALLPGGAPLSFILSRSPRASSCAAFVYGVFSRLHDAGSCAYERGVSRKRGTIDVDIKLDGPTSPSNLTF